MANSQIFAPSLHPVPEQEKHGVNHSEGLIQKSNLVASSLDPVSHGSKSDLSLILVPDRKQYQKPKGAATHTVQTMILDPVQDRMKSNGQSVADTSLASVADTSWATANTADICKKFKLIPKNYKRSYKMSSKT